MNKLETQAREELEYAREHDYVWYFDMLMEQAGCSENPEEEILKVYDEHWQKTKEAIKKDYFSETADGFLAKPSPFYMMSLRDGYEMLYVNIIGDIDMELQNARRYDDRAAFARDCLEVFDLEEMGPNYTLMNTQLAIGEALSDGGHIAESDEYYEKLLAENPGNGYMIANYVLTMKLRGEKERAREYLEKYISPDMEPTEENEMLFERAIELYEETGDTELVKKYTRLQDEIHSYQKESAYHGIPGAFPSMTLDPAKTVVRTEKKVYPNDPCPCGSGKKYKKCCGRI
ncbi:MAG: SEC-C metal-binding domain-containing protein [Agathobacter sp.]|nr:SEC-C metal-binding domain-containing protein [Agathobacter sp.]